MQQMLMTTYMCHKNFYLASASLNFLQLMLLIFAVLQFLQFVFQVQWKAVDFNGTCTQQ